VAPPREVLVATAAAAARTACSLLGDDDDDGGGAYADAGFAVCVTRDHARRATQAAR